MAEPDDGVEDLAGCDAGWEDFVVCAGAGFSTGLLGVGAGVWTIVCVTTGGVVSAGGGVTTGAGLGGANRRLCGRGADVVTAGGGAGGGGTRVGCALGGSFSGPTW